MTRGIQFNGVRSHSRVERFASEPLTSQTLTNESRKKHVQVRTKLLHHVHGRSLGMVSLKSAQKCIGYRKTSGRTTASVIPTKSISYKRILFFFPC